MAPDFKFCFKENGFDGGIAKENVYIEEKYNKVTQMPSLNVIGNFKNLNMFSSITLPLFWL